MAYSKITLDDLKKHYGIERKTEHFLPTITPIEPSVYLKEQLRRAAKQSLLTEKAKSEQIVAPILTDLWVNNDEKFSIFSGVYLNAKDELGGECDFILSKKPAIRYLEAPIFTLVEAKNDDIDAGIMQCAAQMVGAKVYNEDFKENIPCIYGCSTTSKEWTFLMLKNNVLYIDTETYYLKSELSTILGVFQIIIDDLLN